MTGEEKRESGVSRREALQTGTFATAGLLGLSSLGSDSATAQSSEPRIRLGDEWVIDPDGDDFSIEHSSLGVSFVWDESAGHWVPGGGGFDMDGEDIVDNGTTVYDASTDTVGDGSTSADHQSVDTDELSITNTLGEIELVGHGTASVPNNGSTQVVSSYSESDNGAIFVSISPDGDAGSTSNASHGGGRAEEFSWRVEPEGDGSGVGIWLHKDGTVGISVKWLAFEFIAP
jgi:hypothetical protein